MFINSGLMYLASPYTTKDLGILQWRVEQNLLVAACLMEAGYRVFAPIAHSHHIAAFLNPACDNHNFWLEQDIAILKHASALIVLSLPGWAESKGVAQEIKVAKECQIPIHFITVEQAKQLARDTLPNPAMSEA